MSLIAGAVKDLAATVRVLASGAPKVSGTVYVAIRLELDGNVSDGMRYCSTHSTWEASPHAFPEAAYDAAGDWIYQLAAAATTGLVSTTKPARVRWRMTDNVSTPASETASSGEFEDVIYSNGAAESSVDATKWLGTAIAAPDTAGYPKVTVKSGTGTGEIVTSSGLANADAIRIGGVVQTGDDIVYLLGNLNDDVTSIPEDLLSLSNGVEAGITPRQALRAIAAMLAGIISGGGTGTEVFKAIGAASGGTTRVTVTVDSSGNRSVMSLNL